MAQRVETKPLAADEYQRVEKSEAVSQFTMVQGIRKEIVAMLAAKKRGFSADEYQLLGREGILTEDDRVELIDGEIVLMSPIGSRHAACVDMLAEQLFSRVNGQAIVRVQSSVRLGDDSEPQPDLALLRPKDDFYAAAHPTSEDILLLIEVADSSLEDDRKKATNSYVRHLIPEVWIANLSDDCVERYRNPAKGGYDDVREFRRGEAISPELLPDVELKVDSILP